MGSSSSLFVLVAGAGEEVNEGVKWTCGCSCGEGARSDVGGGTMRKEVVEVSSRCEIHRACVSWRNVEAVLKHVLS